MTDIGVEVGQKMRSAIRAKLTELDCYVDDELPDYIMVMIANKRTKSQMKEDLQLFLSSKTTTFVEWLHIVLKKLKEVHVTNPDVFKKPVKRKSDAEEDIKSIKKEKKEEAKALKKARKEAKASREFKSLTDDLPITANKLSEARKIIVMKEQQLSQNSIIEGGSGIDEDSFDIPLLSEISDVTNEDELEIIEKKIKTVKSRLGIQVESDEGDCLNIKPDPDDLLLNDQLQSKFSQLKKPNVEKKVVIIEEATSNTEEQEEEIQKRAVHTRITFDREKDSLKAKYEAILNRHKEESQSKKKSVLERLGRKPEKPKSPEKRDDDVRRRISIKKVDKPKEGILSRLGVMSKVSVPPKRSKTPEQEMDEEEEIKMTLKEVPSVVKIKPRVLPPKTKQANPNLLFKAVAEAQRSVSQTPAIGSVNNLENKGNNQDSTALFTKKYKEKMENKLIRKAKLLDDEKKKLKVLLSQCENSTENIDDYSDKKDSTHLNIQFSSNSTEHLDVQLINSNVNQKFIVTLDGIEKTKFASAKDEQRSIVKTRRTPSPIIFDKPKSAKLSIVPDKLPVIHPPPALKNKERCKYWPGCRQGEKCEFVHPSTPCKMFPNCKFEDKCLYIHPSCKFESSCTRRDCPYSHKGRNLPRMPPATTGNQQKPISQICKFFPNCSNPHCTFYHPRLCKFGVFCKNQIECNFVHSFAAKSANLTWRSDHK